MPRLITGLCLVALALPHAAPAQQTQSAGFTLEQIRSYPFPNELTASTTGARVAWAFNERGLRNLYVAEGPAFTARRLTNYQADDGQEVTSVSLSADGQWVVYVRGGDHGSNWDDGLPVNPTFMPNPPKVQVWAARFTGGEPKLLADGDFPVISPKSDLVAFERGSQIWTVPIDGSASAKQLFTARGSNGDPTWSPDGSKLAFVSNRTDHAFIGVYSNATTPIRWIAPSYSRDGSPRWSPDGRRIAFVRTMGAGGSPDSMLVRRHRPWSIHSADVTSGEARMLWEAPKTLAGSIPTTHGGTNLHWAAGGRIVFLSYQDGWPHLYSIAETGGEPLLLTPGRYMAEYITLSPDRRWLVFAGNTGKDSLDIDRRHVVRVPVDRAAPEVMTPGAGLEWTPVVTGDGRSIAFIGATHERPPLPMVMPMAPGAVSKTLAADRVPADYPTGQLVVPKQVIFRAPDGVTVHAQLFERAGGPAKKPAVVYVHGGPPRQMLLGWHYSDYYSNAYALNQYLASRGFAVLSVNYRLGIGYGHEFHQPAAGGTAGASEYQDVKAGGEWLAKQAQVDPGRIGIYGGSYGGYLTALALGRDSKLFAAGVDIHGVHDRSSRAMLNPERYERAPDAERAFEVAWESSPTSAIPTWKSPVLIIHADDDRNVRFSQSTDLVRRLEAAGVPMETLVIVDDTHHFMRHANVMTVDRATAEFLERKLMGAAASTSSTSARPRQ
jgi:dipeptidyl aminopeptidase/acylaminoacyl peptidase